MSRPTVALFRAPDDAERSASALAARGVAAVIAPALELHAVAGGPPDGQFDFVIATSAKAIELAPAATLAIARNLPLRAVGETTVAAARRAGLSIAAPAANDVAALLPTLPEGRALYLAGRDRKAALERELGGRVATHVVYEARARERWSEPEAAAVAAAGAGLHYSERTAAIVVRLAEAAGVGAALRRLPHVCLSRDAARPLAAFGAVRVLWPRLAQQEALFDTLESALAG